MPGVAVNGEGLLPILWRSRWLILLALLLAGAGAYGYLLAVEPQYTGTARLLVEKIGTVRDRTAPVDLGAASANFLQTQTVLMTSPAVVARALHDPNVLSLPSGEYTNYFRKLVGTLSAEVGKDGDVIDLSASSPHAEGAATIVNAVVRSYIQWHRENRQLSAADLHRDLSRQLDDRRLQLRDRRQERMTYEQRHPEVIESTRGGILSETLDLLKQELAAARVRVTERDSYHGGLQQYQSDPNKFWQYVLSGPSAGVIREGAERGQIEAELRQTELTLSETAAGLLPALKTRTKFLESRRQQLRERLGELDGAFIRNHIALAKAQADDATARERQLTKLYQEEFDKVQRVAGQNSEYAMMTAECDMLENLCNTLLKQISDLDLNSLRGLSIHVLQWANPARRPSAPNPIEVIGIALALGILGGAGLSFVRDWRDQRVRSAAEITAILGAPILGTVPALSRRYRARAHELRFAGNSRESEAYRAIRTALLCGAPQEQAATLLVTSPGPLEGKTTLVANLAVAMAHAGQRTLIIDADLRQPMQSRTFAANERGLGLSDVLMGRAALQEVIRPTGIERLDVLPSGGSIPNASELLNSPAFAEMLEQLRHGYDRILIDSPPVGIVTDAQIIASRCGLTLLVLRADRSSRPLTQQARNALSIVGATIAGVVVNDVRRKNTRYGHQSGNGYHYGSHAANGFGPARKELQGGTAARPPDGSPERPGTESRGRPVTEGR
jgi:capsular exopolysaccharide synthesis family protein